MRELNCQMSSTDGYFGKGEYNKETSYEIYNKEKFYKVLKNRLLKKR